MIKVSTVYLFRLFFFSEQNSNAKNVCLNLRAIPSIIMGVRKFRIFKNGELTSINKDRSLPL